jgi:hypothetical protein
VKARSNVTNGFPSREALLGSWKLVEVLGRRNNLRRVICANKTAKKGKPIFFSFGETET